MSDVTLTFTANDQGVVQSLARQEAAINASIGRMQNRYAGVTNKFAGPGALGGILGGIGIGSAFAAGAKLIDGYSKSSDAAAAAFDRMKQSWEALWKTAGGATAGGFVDAATSAIEAATKNVSVLFGAYGLLASDVFKDFGEGFLRSNELDRWAARSKRSIDDVASSMLALNAASAGSRAERVAGLRRSGLDFDADLMEASNRRKDALLALRSDFESSRRSGNPMGDDVYRASLRSIDDIYSGAVKKAEMERDARDEATRERNRDRLDREEDDARTRAFRNQDARIEASAMQATILRAQGRTREADQLEAQVSFQETLLRIEQDRLLTADVKTSLEARAAELFAARLASIDEAGRAIFGGRGVDAGLASAPGVVRGSLVATARDNPAAIQRETNQILRKILEAVNDGGSAVFAP